MDPMNIKDIYCRICGIKSKKSVKIFSRKGRGMGLESKILKCLMLSVRKSDQLPTRVCFSCIDRLDDYSQFILHVKQAQVKLRVMLKSQGVHVKEERSNELIATWKALLAHQERESVVSERGRKRKRKGVEKVYDLPYSSSSDSVSDDSSSDVDNDSDGDPPCKKAALSNQKTTVMEIPVKNEATDVSGTTGNTPVEQQNSADDSDLSKSNSSNLNSDAINVCSSNHLPCSSSNVPSKVSEMQEDKISTSQEPVSLVDGSSSSIPHPTPSTTSDINVTISPPLFFPAQMSNPMIVLPGTSNPSSGGMVPFYIWSMPKGGVSNEVSKTSLPSVAVGKCKKPTSFEKQKVPCDVLSNRSFLSKPAVETISDGKMIVVLHSDNANSLPTAISSQTPAVTANSDVSNVCTEVSNMSQESQLKESNLKETTVETNSVVVNKSLAHPSQDIEISPQISDCSEQLKNKSIPPTNSERTVQPSNPCPMLEESSQLIELEGIRVQVSPVKLGQGIQLVGNGSAHLPSSQEACGVNLNGSSNAMMPVLISNEDVSKNGVSTIHKGSQDVVPSKGSHEVSDTPIINKMCANSAGLGSTHKPSSKKSKVVPENINSVILQDTSTESNSEDSVEVESASTAASVVAEAVASDLTSMSCTQESNSTDMAQSSGSSVSSKSSGKEIEVYDLCDIPPLIPISESLMKDASDVECVDSPASTSSPTITVENDHEEEIEALVLERVPKSDSKKTDMEVTISCVSKNPKQSKAAKSSSSSAKKRKESTVSNSGSSNNSSATAQKSSEWLVTESIGVNFTVDTDFSVVKCCLCSTDTYPFLITLASASDHCKFIHSQGTGSFGCIKCDFTSDEQLQIPQQLEALHHHIVSGCPPPEAPGSDSPHGTTENGLDVTQVKMEPVDVYETALKNLKNSLQKVNMPRFRKLLTTFAPSSSNTAEVPVSKVKEEAAEGTSKEVEIMLMDRSRNKLFTRKGSAYICRICSKKTYSKHQVKNHIGWHKPSERERLHIADFRQSVALSSGKECGEMIFDIPAIKVEKDDSPQAMDANGVVDASSYLSDSPCNTSVAVLTSDPSTPKMSPKKASKSVGKTSGNCEKGASKNEAVHVSQSHPSASNSNVKVPFIKREPSMLSSTDKVTHKTSTNNSFSFTVIPKRSLDESDVSYVNPSRNFRSKPIVKPLYKSPTAPKDSSSSVVSPLASSGGFSPGSHLKVEKPSPVKHVVEGKQPCKSKISFKIVKPGSDPCTSYPSKSKKLVGEGESKADALLTRIVVRKNLNGMGVIRTNVSIGSGNGKDTEQSSPLIKRPLSNSVPAQALYSPLKSKTEHPDVNSTKKSLNESVTVNSPKKIVSESMTVNGLVLKVPFIKLQRLNLLNIDPRTGFMNKSAALSGSEENVNKESSEDTRHGEVVNQSENTGERSQKPSTS